MSPLAPVPALDGPHLRDERRDNVEEYDSGSLTAYREPDGIALDVTGRFFVTADEGDTRNAAGASGPRGGRGARRTSGAAA